MYHVRNVLPPLDTTQQGDPRPRNVVLLSRDAHDTNVRRRGVVFYCITISIPLNIRDEIEHATGQRGRDRAPSRVPEVCEDALLERGPELFARQLGRGGSRCGAV